MVRRQVPETFDGARDFVVRRRMRFNGKDLVRGMPFNKAGVEPRRLRVLYDEGLIELAPAVAITPETPRASYLADLTAEQLRDWLKIRGESVHPRLGREKLLKLAEDVLVRDAGGVPS